MARPGHRVTGAETALRAAESVLREIREEERTGQMLHLCGPRVPVARTLTGRVEERA